MIEVLKIIMRIICAVLPALWLFTIYMSLHKDKLLNLFGHITLILSGMGLAYCVTIAAGVWF